MNVTLIIPGSNNGSGGDRRNNDGTVSGDVKSDGGGGCNSGLSFAALGIIISAKFLRKR